MRLLIQRVSQANVAVDNNIIGEIKRGFLVLVGIEDADTVEDAEWLAQKLDCQSIHTARINQKGQPPIVHSRCTSRTRRTFVQSIYRNMPQPDW